MKKEKTVYILGAGASVSAGLPTQVGILSTIFTISEVNIKKEVELSDFMSLDIDNNNQRLEDLYETFDKDRQELGEFIIENFSTSEKLEQYELALRKANDIKNSEVDKSKMILNEAYEIAKSVTVSLEDLFTIFDNINSGREHFRLYSQSSMSEMHDKLKMCVIYAISYLRLKHCNNADYEKFAEMLLKTRLKATLTEDVISVITMNWDDILEHVLFEKCREYNADKKHNGQKILPDLCFYNYDFKQNKKHIPSIQIKAKGIKNIKILKMHGSLAWLECPKCGRIFTDFSEEIAYKAAINLECPICTAEEDYFDREAPALRNLIITPTFIKSLDNLNVKNIWQNALLDISRASHIVFIGYSFPDADFEMRCLLKKSIKKSAKITVVLSEDDNPQKWRELFQAKNVPEDTIESILERMYLPEKRYQSFFGKDNVEFKYEGFCSYIDEMEA